VHPGNRGAVWYKIELNGEAAPAADLVALASDIILELEREGAAIKNESEHPLFPHRPVQTCHGILGPWGEHPSAVNDHIELAVAFQEALDEAALRSAVDRAVANYVEVYGDKTQETDPKTGQPKVDHHVDLSVEDNAARLAVHGKAGHMGAVAQCDNAVTKAAYIVRRLRADFGESIRAFSLQPDAPAVQPGTLVLEGGQGFLPTHTLADVTRRMEEAARRAAREHCKAAGLDFADGLLDVTFDKLHNDAFARPADAPAVQALVASARAAGIEITEPLRGWDVSCDARIFAREYPDSAVITFGAGHLQHAHAANEQVRLDDIALAAKTLAHFALTYTPQP
jgi:acetylornithine deacetylase/succinyl-diaminopimelate desuccinylase-like protein